MFLVGSLLAANASTNSAAAFLSDHPARGPKRQDLRHVISIEKASSTSIVKSKARGYRFLQYSRNKATFSRIKTNTQRSYPSPDLRGEGGSSAFSQATLLDDDILDDPLLKKNRKKPTNYEEEYRIIPDAERESKILSNNKKSSSSKSKSIPKNKQKTTALQATAMAQGQHADSQNPFVAMQQSFEEFTQSLDDFKLQVQTRINEPIVETIGAIMILFSSILVAVTTLPNIPPDVLVRMETLQEGLALLFLVEFITRWLSSDEERGKYVTQPLVLVDFAVVVLPLLLTTFPMLDTAFPEVLSGQSGLINLRLLRVLRLQRVLKDELTFSRFVYALQLNDKASGVIVQQWELQLARVLLSIFTLLSVAAGLIFTTEHAVNPAFSDYFTALYFTITTLTTVGFGDITPVTWEGRLAVSASILAGVTIIPSQAAALVEALLQREDEKRREQEEERYPPNMYQSATSSIAHNKNKNGEDTSMTSTAATLQAAQTCPTCKVGLHWSHANYCYNCASPLHSDTSLLLPDKR